MAMSPTGDTCPGNDAGFRGQWREDHLARKTAPRYAVAMPILRSFGFLSVVTLALGVSACAAPSNEDEVLVDSSELRGLSPDEILGEIRYGETKTIAYTSTPRYRGFWFQGTKNDWLDVTVTSSTGAPGAFVTDDQFRTVRRGTKAVLRKTGKYWIAVREWDLQPATLTIKFMRRIPSPTEVPPTDEE
jgi:hypothetical protein